MKSGRQVHLCLETQQSALRNFSKVIVCGCVCVLLCVSMCAWASVFISECVYIYTNNTSIRERSGAATTHSRNGHKHAANRAKRWPSLSRALLSLSPSLSRALSLFPFPFSSPFPLSLSLSLLLLSLHRCLPLTHLHCAGTGQQRVPASRATYHTHPTNHTQPTKQARLPPHQMQPQPLQPYFGLKNPKYPSHVPLEIGLFLHGDYAAFEYGGAVSTKTVFSY